MDEEQQLLVRQLLSLRNMVFEQPDNVAAPPLLPEETGWESDDSLLNMPRQKKRSSSRSSSSSYKGVTKIGNKWKVVIRAGRLCTLGTYETEREAAEVYDQASVDYYCSRKTPKRMMAASLNFPEKFAFYQQQESPLRITYIIFGRGGGGGVAGYENKVSKNI